MKYTRKVKFEYYRVVYRNQDDPASEPDRLFDLRRCFDKADRLSLLARTFDYYQEQARLDRFYFRPELNYWFLHFTRLRDTNLPSIATTDSEAEPMELEDDEYIGEDVSALYDEDLHLIMLQRNRFSLAPSGIEKYLNLIWDSEDERIYLRPVPVPDSVQKAHDATFYRKLTVRFADLRNANYEGRSPLVNIINSFGQYNAVQGEVTVNLGHTRGESLTPETVRDSINEIIENRGIITKAELSKKDADDTKVEVIDLFEDKMHDIAYITIEKKRSLEHNDVAFKMYDLYRERKQQIESIIVQSIA